MSKYNEKLATQSFVENSISNLMKTINNPDEAIEAGIYKVIDDDTSVQFDAYILIVQVKPDDSFPIRQTKLTSDGMTYSREFNQFDPPFPEFTQSTVSQNDMALFKLMVDSQFAKIEDELERQKIINTAEGESIAIPDSIEAPFRGLKVMGKTEQVKTNGYQLFDASKIKSTESAGVKFTNNGDGSFTISKANTNDTDATTSAFQVAYEYSHEETVALFKAGKVYIKGDATISPPLSIQKRWTVDGAMKNDSVAFINGTKYITITEDNLNDPTYHIRFTFYASSGTAITGGTIKPMVYQLKNDTDTFDGTFEQFTGGKPAPTTEFPCKLVSVGDDGSVDVDVHGFQLFDANLLSTNEKGGAKVTNNGNGSFSVSGGTELTDVYNGHEYRLSHEQTIKLLKAGTLTLSTEQVTYPYFQVSLYSPANKKSYGTLNNSKTSNISTIIEQEWLDIPDIQLTYLFYGSMTGVTGGKIVPGTIKPMVYQDGYGTWEPFKPIQTLTIPTPNGLPAVPVSSNGNYTDASGQQWVCDEKDYDRGVYAERIYKYIYIGDGKPIIYAPRSNDIIYCRINPPKSLVTHSRLSNFFTPTKIWDDVTSKPYVIYNSKGVIYFSIKAEDLGLNGTEKETEIRAIANDWLAKTFSADNPLIIYCGYVEPDETPLSEAEIAAYKALHTHYPSTSIHNSKNAHMAVDYVADTKNYVDNQIKTQVAELTAAILTQ